MENKADPTSPRWIEEQQRLRIAPDDVPVVQVVDLVWQGRRTIALGALAGLLLALLLALVLPKKYTATTSFMAESSNGNGGLSGLLSGLSGGLAGLQGGLGGLAGVMGGSSGGIPASVMSGGTALPPDYFVALTRSRMMRDTLLDMRFDEAGHPVAQGGRTLLDLLPVRGSTPALRREKAEKLMAKMIVTEVDRKANVVTLSITDRAPARAAALASRTIALLNWYNVSQRQSRSRQQREFAQRRLTAAQADLWEAEATLERFLAGNRSYQLSPVLSTEYARLQRRIQEREGLVSSLTQAYESARLAEAGDLPVLSVIDSAREPATRSFPKLSVFLPLGLLLGLLVGGVLAVARPARRTWGAMARD